MVRHTERTCKASVGLSATCVLPILRCAVRNASVKPCDNISNATANKISAAPKRRESNVSKRTRGQIRTDDTTTPELTYPFECTTNPKRAKVAPNKVEKMLRKGKALNPPEIPEKALNPPKISDNELNPPEIPDKGLNPKISHKGLKPEISDKGKSRLTSSDFVSQKKLEYTGMFFLMDLRRAWESSWGQSNIRDLEMSDFFEGIDIGRPNFMEVHDLPEIYCDIPGFRLKHLYDLFLLVMAEGGFVRVNRNRRWEKYAGTFKTALNLVKQTTLKSVASRLKKIYVTWLKMLESNMGEVLKVSLTQPKIRDQLLNKKKKQIANGAKPRTEPQSVINLVLTSGVAINVHSPQLFNEQLTEAPFFCIGFPAANPASLKKKPVAYCPMAVSHIDYSDASVETTTGSSAEDSDYF